jgi:hypothetical protein
MMLMQTSAASHLASQLPVVTERTADPSRQARARIGRRPARRPPPTLIGAAATLALVARWRSELAVLRRRAAHSDAIATLADCATELEEAIAGSRNISVQLTIADAHALSRIPVGSLRRLCRRHDQLLGARKAEGTWYIDRARFEAYLASPFARSGAHASPDLAADAA